MQRSCHTTIPSYLDTPPRENMERLLAHWKHWKCSNTMKTFAGKQNANTLVVETRQTNPYKKVFVLEFPWKLTEPQREKYTPPLGSVRNPYYGYMCLWKMEWQSQSDHDISVFTTSQFKHQLLNAALTLQSIDICPCWWFVSPQKNQEFFVTSTLERATSSSVDFPMFKHALTGNSLEMKSLKHNLALKLFIQKNPILMKKRKSAGERRANTVQLQC